MFDTREAASNKQSRTAQPSQGAEAVPAAKKLAPLPLWLVSVLVAAVAALYLTGGRGGDEQQKIVILNTKKLLDAKIEQVSSLSSIQAAAAETDGFVQKLKAITEEYTASGHVVLNGAYVVNWPDRLDVTKAVAGQLGVDLALAERKKVAEPSAQPSAPAAAQQPTEQATQKATPSGAGVPQSNGRAASVPNDSRP